MIFRFVLYFKRSEANLCIENNKKKLKKHDYELYYYNEEKNI